MSFPELNINPTYDTDEDNVIRDFYIPVLSNSLSYDRAVGYFNSASFIKTLPGIDGLMKNNGKMRLILGDTLSDSEYDAITQNNQDVYFQKTWEEIYFNAEKSPLLKHRLDVLSWLVNNNRLEIKYALRRAGLYHKKIGIIRDELNNVIVFTGSMNETSSALSANKENPDGNSEEIDLFFSWEDENYFAKHAEKKVYKFEKLWSNQIKNTKTIELSSKEYQNLKSIYTKQDKPRSNIEFEQATIFDSINNENVALPSKPQKLYGETYKLRAHQISALNSWDKADYKGIWALATGSGKTITAIHGAVSLSEAGRSICMVVAVPYKVLAEQWLENLKLFNIFAIKCFDKKDNWISELNRNITDFNSGYKSFFAAVVVNKTLRSKDFQSLVNKINSKKLLFIGDECHHHSGVISKKIPNSRYKIGLSATPWSMNKELSKDELEQKRNLIDTYGEVISEYSLEQAMDDGVLVPYSYHIHRVFFNDEEGEEYRNLMKIISSILSKKQLTPLDKELLKNTNLKKSRLLDNLEEKFESLQRIISDSPVENHTLFYCGSGGAVVLDEDSNSDDDYISHRSIDKITKILDKYGWSVSRFTSEENNFARAQTLENFVSKNINGIAAIKVLDEGFDVPACKTAYITASSNNERQYVQRRGRILRKFPGKKISTIHDFVILPTTYDKSYETLVTNEMRRIENFYKDSSNKIDIISIPYIKEIIELYDVQFDN